MAPDDQPVDPGSIIRIGTICELDVAAARCRVQFGDPESADEAETGWIRWLAGRAGDLRVWSPPSMGEQVLLLCPDGQLAGAVAVAGLWCDAFPAPATDEADEMVWPDGARIRYDHETGELTALLPAGATVQITAPGGVTIEADSITLRGDVSIEGKLDVSEGIEAQGDVVGEGISLASHRHPGVQPGGGQTGTPL